VALNPQLLAFSLLFGGAAAAAQEIWVSHRDRRHLEALPALSKIGQDYYNQFSGILQPAGHLQGRPYGGADEIPTSSPYFFGQPARSASTIMLTPIRSFPRLQGLKLSNCAATSQE